MVKFRVITYDGGRTFSGSPLYSSRSGVYQHYSLLYFTEDRQYKLLRYRRAERGNNNNYLVVEHTCSTIIDSIKILIGFEEVTEDMLTIYDKIVAELGPFLVSTCKVNKVTEV